MTRTRRSLVLSLCASLAAALPPLLSQHAVEPVQLERERALTDADLDGCTTFAPTMSPDCIKSVLEDASRDCDTVADPDRLPCKIEAGKDESGARGVSYALSEALQDRCGERPPERSLVDFTYIGNADLGGNSQTVRPLLEFKLTEQSIHITMRAPAKKDVREQSDGSLAKKSKGTRLQQHIHADISLIKQVRLRGPMLDWDCKWTTSKCSSIIISFHQEEGKPFENGKLR